MTFRDRAVNLVGRIVRGRMWCVKNKVGIVLTKTEYSEINTLYAAHHSTWKEIGIARFIVRHQKKLSLMCKSTSQATQLNELITEAKPIITQYNERTSNTIQHAHGSIHIKRAENTNATINRTKSY